MRTVWTQALAPDGEMDKTLVPDGSSSSTCQKSKSGWQALTLLASTFSSNSLSTGPGFQPKATDMSGNDDIISTAAQHILHVTYVFLYNIRAEQPFLCFHCPVPYNLHWLYTLIIWGHSYEDEREIHVVQEE